MMATIVPLPPASEVKRQDPSRGEASGSGGLTGDGIDGFQDRVVSDGRYYTGMLVGLAAIVMLFTAFTSAYVVRKGVSDDWRPTGTPAILWINTLVLVASSVTLERARRRFSQRSHFGRWWSVTTLLGGCFLIGQVLAWRQLVGNGVYLNTNPSSSFFYLLTGTHAVHLLGGIIALMWVVWKLWGQYPAPISRTAVGVTALYWHFMDGLWIYLFLLLIFLR